MLLGGGWRNRRYDAEKLEAYRFWLDSIPRLWNTVNCGLRGRPN